MPKPHSVLRYLLEREVQIRARMHPRRRCNMHLQYARRGGENAWQDRPRPCRIFQITAPSDFPAEQAAPLGLLIGSRDGADGDAEPPGKFPVRGQPIAGLQLPFGEIGGNGIRNGDIARPVGGKCRYPTCHGDNVSFDGDNYAYYKIVTLGGKRN
jgi:hypothetical protein